MGGLNIKRRLRAVCLASAVWTALCASAPIVANAQTDLSHATQGLEFSGYVGQDVMIPMRDGVRLHAEVWRPKGATGRLPILMQRSPYGFDVERLKHYFGSQYKELAAEGFIFVLEDIRGRFGSEGEFVMLRPKALSADGIDESTDTYDSIDWLVTCLPDNNGKVGIFGVSYLGWTSAMATINPHPALKAVSVQGAPEDMYIGDDFHHNGAFRLDYGWEYAAWLETDGRTLNPFSFGADDPYGWFLKQDHLADLDHRVLGKTLPSWQNFVTHPNYDAFWKAGVTTAQMPAEPSVPNLIVAGWYDQEDFYGPLTIYKRQAPSDTLNRNFLVVGPWNHGGWAHSKGDTYGPFSLGSDTGDYFRGHVETPWFKYWLKGEGSQEFPKALIFETGSNEWHSYAAWPPKSDVSEQHLYFHANGKLSFTPPAAQEAKANAFISDPANPVPYRERPISPMAAADTTWGAWLADDQAVFSKRKDVVTWQTEVLDEDVTLRGNVVANLFASTTGTDADWIVKLIDVYPSDGTTPADLRGRQLMIANDVFRGRFRSSFSDPKALTPNKVLDYTIDLHSASHVFKKGHRIAVQVQSTWFPLIDRNPQTFVPNIFEARAADFKSQTHKIYHSPDYPSSLTIDVATSRAH
jgi:putative CocE/NonD family hydrolase